MAISLSKDSRVFHYADVFFGYYFNDDESCAQTMKEHTLVYLYSGEVEVQEDGKTTTIIQPGECVFLHRNHRVTVFKRPKDGQQFKGIFMKFTRPFLREFYHTINKKETQPIQKPAQAVIKLPSSPDITSLFQSLVPYFNTNHKASEELMRLKQQEGVFSLLNINPDFHATLFDFTDPWKIDILDFLDNNYMYDLSIEEIANFTGRSLATFKRDFKKLTDLSPRKWVMQKRLRIAHEKIKHEKKKVSDVYLEVGFKDLSHFSKAYKENYGYSPTSV